MNVFVQRIDGVVQGVFANPQPGLAEEKLPEDHADVVAFQGRSSEAKSDVLTRLAALEARNKALEAELTEKSGLNISAVDAKVGAAVEPPKG